MRPRSLFSQIFKGLLFAWTLSIHRPNLKFVVLPVREIIGGTQKTWAVPGYAHAPFSPKFFMGLCLDGPYECIGKNLQSIALAVPEIIAIAVLGWVANPQSWGRVGRRGSGMALF